MPIYEFYCPDNNKIYSFLARSLAHVGKIPRCPANPALRMERLISSFAVTGRAKKEISVPERGIDDAGMDRMMGEVEREFSGMEDKEPDPKQLARMMQKMSACTGEKLPPPMQEMMKRMEAGEDPEKLESEYGDALEEFEGASDSPANERDASGKKHRANRGRPERDPTLHEITDYLAGP